MIHCINKDGWILSTQKNHESYVEEDKTFLKYSKEQGKEIWGKSLQNEKQFPITIREINQEELSPVQLHAKGVKMWYVLECKENAAIYFGCQYTIGKGDLKKRFKNNTLLDVLKKEEIEPGSVFQVEPGTMFAMQGVRILEISENVGQSVLTMKDKMDKWVCLANVHPLDFDYGEEGSIVEDEKGQTVVLSVNPLFISFETQLKEGGFIQTDEDSFGFVYVLDNGKAYFLSADGDKLSLEGKCTYLYVRM